MWWIDWSRVRTKVNEEAALITQEKQLGGDGGDRGGEQEADLDTWSERKFPQCPLRGSLCESPGIYWAGLDVGSLGGAHLKADTGPEDGHSDGVLWATETFYLGQYAGVPLPRMKDYTPLKSGSCVKSLCKLFSSDPSINIALRESAPNAMLDLNCPEQWLSHTWSRFSWLNSCPESDKFMIWELFHFSAWITQ